MNARLRTGLVAAAVIALAIMVGLAGWASYRVSHRYSGEPTAPPQRLCFALSDHHGRPFTDRDLAGRFALVYFGYTFCPDICPTELGFIHRLLKRLGGTGDRLVPLFITIDPARDTAAVLAGYVPLFDPRMVGLTGSPEAIAAAAASVGAFFQRADVISSQPGFYLMDHSLSTYLVGPDGAVLATYDSHQPLDQAAEDIRHRLSLTESP
jgi:cytochrome oxidase Cu insertion factor (SCO1/SenC/PrrC family)